MRLDWTVDLTKVPEFCAGPVTSCFLSGWLRLGEAVAVVCRVDVLPCLPAVGEVRCPSPSCLKLGCDANDLVVPEASCSKEQVKHGNGRAIAMLLAQF